MATSKECNFYKQCGFVKWRKENKVAEPLPEDGDCGIPITICPRRRIRNGSSPQPVGIKISVDRLGPITDLEMQVGLNRKG